MFYYYGSKYRMARRYPQPRLGVIVEPFAGAAGYGIYHLVRRHADRLILVEKDARVCEVWRRLLTMNPTDVLRLPIPQAGEVVKDFLYMTAATSNGIGSSRKMTVTPRMPELIESMLRRIAILLPLVQDRIVIIEGDYNLAPEIEATWFIDPPYQVQPGISNTGSPRGMGYAADCRSTSIDYVALGRWCLSRPGQVIVTEQSPASWLPFSFHATQQNSIGNLYDEVLWHSDGAAAQQLPMFNQSNHAIDCDLDDYCMCDVRPAA
jgi:16S rRNA G966 N2-methylase RsmD